MTRRRAPTTVELDDALARFDKAFTALTRAQRDALAASMPPGVRARADQTLAARAEAAALLRRIDPCGQWPKGRTREQVRDWLRLSTLDVFRTWGRRRRENVVHMPDPDKPEPVWSCAWKPNLVVCSMCLPLLKAVGDVDRTYDCCGHLCAGVLDRIAYGECTIGGYWAVSRVVPDWIPLDYLDALLAKPDKPLVRVDDAVLQRHLISILGKPNSTERHHR